MDFVENPLCSIKDSTFEPYLKTVSLKCLEYEIYYSL